MEEHKETDESEGVGKKLISIQEATEMLSISKWTLYKLLQRNEIKSMKVGARRLIPTAEIDAFVRRNTDEMNQWS